MLNLKEMTCLLSRWALVLGLLVAPIVGCSDLSGDGGTGGTGGNGGTGGDAGNGGTGGTSGPELLQALVTYVANNPDGDDPPLEGVNACVEYGETQSCFLTNASGRAVVDFPADLAFTWTSEKEGYGSLIGGAGENAFGPAWRPSGALTLVMYTDAQLEAIAAEQLQLDPAYPWNGGIVGLVANTGTGLAGVTFAPVGSTIGAVGQAFYFDAGTEQYSIDLEATTSFPFVYDQFPFAEGGFTEVAPGVQQFEIGGMIGDCQGPSFGWSGDTANSIRVPVREGFRTYGSMQCDPP
ncbi:MAG: hypothetical protein WBM46_05405 [Polyangiales bacterium]